MALQAGARGNEGQLELSAVSARAEMVSGGDVLVRIALPRNVSPTDVEVLLNGVNVGSAFKPVVYAAAFEEGKATPATLLDVEGGWSAVLHVPATRGEDEWVIALAESDGVLVHPGYFFDFPREAYLVLSLLPPEPEFAEAVARILARVTKSA